MPLIGSNTKKIKRNQLHELISPTVRSEEKLSPKQSSLDKYMNPSMVQGTTSENTAGVEKVDLVKNQESTESASGQFQIPDDEMVMFQKLYQIPHLLPKLKAWITGEMNTYISSLQQTLQTSVFSPSNEKKMVRNASPIPHENSS